jgi:hypothetical protein
MSMIRAKRRRCEFEIFEDTRTRAEEELERQNASDSDKENEYSVLKHTEGNHHTVRQIQALKDITEFVNAHRA